MKEIDVKVSGISDELWNMAIEEGYLPVLAIRNPRRFMGTQIHFPDIAPNTRWTVEEYREYIQGADVWKIVNSMDILKHLARAKGIIVFTSPRLPEYQDILIDLLKKYVKSVERYRGESY